MGKDISSEEKLLKLIRKRDAGPNPRAVAVAGDKGPFILINSSLIVLIILSAGYAVTNAFVLRQRSVERYISGLDFSETKFLIRPEREDKSFADYEEQFGRRDIFNFGLREQPQPDVEVSQPVAQISPTQTLRIVGIVLNNKPQVVIEDVSGQRTYFLYEGDRLKDMTVEKIAEDEIIFDQGGQQYKLLP